MKLQALATGIVVGVASSTLVIGLMLLSSGVVNIDRVELPTHHNESAAPSEAELVVGYYASKGLKPHEYDELRALYKSMSPQYQEKVVKYILSEMRQPANTYNQCYELGEGMFSVGLEYCE